LSAAISLVVRNEEFSNNWEVDKNGGASGMVARIECLQIETLANTNAHSNSFFPDLLLAGSTIPN
jgi:hypothetical protein